VGVAACLAVTDHASAAFFSKAYLGGNPLCFAKSPAVSILCQNPASVDAFRKSCRRLPSPLLCSSSDSCAGSVCRTSNLRSQTFVAHTFIFIFTGVTAYVGLDSAFSPLHKVIFPFMKRPS
jgi:hypothetical protein